MKDALTLMQEYKKKQEPKPAEDNLTPIIEKLVSSLKEIAEKKESPIEITNEIMPSDVKVDAPIINFPEIVLPKYKAPTINIDSVDYSKLLTELKISVDSLKVAVENRPKRWKVQRVKGFIDEVVGIEGEIGKE